MTPVLLVAESGGEALSRDEEEKRKQSGFFIYCVMYPGTGKRVVQKGGRLSRKKDYGGGCYNGDGQSQSR